MAVALGDAYGYLFTIRANPTPAGRRLIEGKFRSVHNASALTAKLMASTFYSLLEMADLTPAMAPKKEEKESGKESEAPPPPKSAPSPDISRSNHGPTFH